MGRPRKEDRNTVASVQFSVRFNVIESLALDALVADTNERAQAAGVPAVISRTDMLRSLVMQEATRRGMVKLATAPDDGRDFTPAPMKIAAMKIDPEIRKTVVWSSKPPKKPKKAGKS
jgi:hypothetical protein